MWAALADGVDGAPADNYPEEEKSVSGSEIVGGGKPELNSRSGVACGSASMHHCCCSPFRDADRDLLRLLLTTSAARVQCRSDVDGSWS